jgi:hypothetical protein
MKLHFWLRIEGDIGREKFDGLPLAELDNGHLAKYHMADPDFARANREIVQCSLFHWKYLGTGRLYMVDGVVPGHAEHGVSGAMPSREEGAM